MPSPTSAPPPVPISFKRVALSLGICAIIVAVLNLYMNLIANYGMSSLQLDMSADGDVIGFHQFDLNAAGGTEQQQGKNQPDYSNPGGVLRHGKQFRKGGLGQKVADSPLEKGNAVSAQDTVASCPGLCPPSELWPKTQAGFVQALVGKRWGSVILRN